MMMILYFAFLHNFLNVTNLKPAHKNFAED